ncbi:MAG: patatin-like phospholipase family protein [Actinomycetota bacterium]|nr:patatin-like phospholipase family protein [Actinomycetota bacterium]
MSEQSFNILSIDGGGIRGIIPAVVLTELERRTGRRVADMFDLIAGTSTGGILAAALTVHDEAGNLRWTAEQLIDLYFSEGPDIFSQSLTDKILNPLGLLDERYDDTALERAIDKYIGDARLTDLATDVLLTAYDTEGRAPFFFKSYVAAGAPSWNHRVSDAVRATVAAPTYFEPHLLITATQRYSLVDGGVFANNPAMSAYAEADRIAPGRPVRIVSLGTGSLNRCYPYNDVKGWGVVEWIRPLIATVFDGQSDAVTMQLDELLVERHHRFQIELNGASDDLDDVRPENLEALQRLGDALVEGATAQLDQVVEALIDR